ncbi:MAG: hypothetical protein BWY63_02186 [Chloroflexi bacterium ADurb.Bin360]|nr:MAG: hypothetical protein BWY63_02186 [Chloroflexi bacterium ADurb.Bin360]
MQVKQNTTQLLCPVEHLLFFVRLLDFIQQRLKCFAWDVFHHHIMGSFNLKSICHSDQIRMLQRSQQFGFAPESLNDLLPLRSCDGSLIHLLDGNDFVAQAFIHRSVDCAHTALSRSLQNYITLNQGGCAQQPPAGSAPDDRGQGHRFL